MNNQLDESLKLHFSDDESKDSDGDDDFMVAERGNVCSILYQTILHTFLQ